MKKKGTSMVPVDGAGAGDIISMAGLGTPSIGHTVANVEVCLPILCLIPKFCIEKGDGTIMIPYLN